VTRGGIVAWGGAVVNRLVANGLSRFQRSNQMQLRYNCAVLAELIVGGLLVALGFGLGFIPPLLDRQRRMKLHWQALRAENLLVSERVSNLLNDNVAAPLYRLPLRAFDAALSSLLADGAHITPDKIKVLYEAADLIGDINRGLDACAELAVTNPEGSALRSNVNRNLEKAERLNAVVLPAVARLVHEMLADPSTSGADAS
jgi:hypothetical protein